MPDLRRLLPDVLKRVLPVGQSSSDEGPNPIHFDPTYQWDYFSDGHVPEDEQGPVLPPRSEDEH